MDLLQKGWFTEFSPDDLERIKNSSDGKEKQLKSDGEDMGGAWPGQAFSLQMEEVLFHEKSLYQDVLVFKSKTYGNVLVLDGVIQCTERDEFAYQEMLAHLPMFAHPNPKKVLIIGGGDGGILREVLKHDTVEHVTMCEIDKMVIDVSKKYLPHMSKEFGNSKLNLFIGDGFEFLKAHKNEFDVVITDSSDPVGPAESLFGKSYYQLLKEALRDGGVLSSQGECPWIDLDLVRKMIAFCRELFSEVRYAVASVPTYTTGTMGYLLCTNEERDLSVPSRILTDEQVKAMGLRFYNSDVHRAAFVLPQFMKEALQKSV
uniref:Spermidine synthase n=1 Tax=Steinernema glaseri TaxID=37863 RepID=A0A1I7YRW7_9BILA